MTEEVWSPVIGFEGAYEVSSMGRIRTIERMVKTCHGSDRIGVSKLLKPFKDKDGYLNIRLSFNGRKKTFKMHRLVAMIFIPNPDEKPQVNHINFRKEDNSVSNLGWCTAKENNAHRCRGEGRRGVQRRGNRFQAKIKIEGHTYSIGYFQFKYQAENAFGDVYKEWYGVPAW